MQVTSEHVLDLFAAFALPCSPGGAACIASGAAALAAGLGRDSPGGSSGSLIRHSPSQYAVPEDEAAGDGLAPRWGDFFFSTPVESVAFATGEHLQCRAVAGMHPEQNSLGRARPGGLCGCSPRSRDLQPRVGPCKLLSCNLDGAPSEGLLPLVEALHATRVHCTLLFVQTRVSSCQRTFCCRSFSGTA